MTPSVQRGLAVPGQPEPHIYFHRPLGELLSIAFRHGFVLDALEEAPSPPVSRTRSNSLGWGSSFSEFPPVLVARMRHATAGQLNPARHPRQSRTRHLTAVAGKTTCGVQTRTAISAV